MLKGSDLVQEKELQWVQELARSMVQSMGKWWDFHSEHVLAHPLVSRTGIQMDVWWDLKMEIQMAPLKENCLELLMEQWMDQWWDA
jgi:hypothetical protein